MDKRIYVLSVPVAPGHYVSVWSNKMLEPCHFERLKSYLALQEEIAAQAIEARSGETGTGSFRQDESAVAQAMRPEDV